MRLLSLNIQDSFINYLEENNLYICDKAEDFNDAIYHSEVRYYNLIIIKSTDFKEILYMIKQQNSKETPVILLSQNLSKNEMIQLYKKGVLFIQENNDKELLLAKIQSIHKENFTENFNFNNLLQIYRKKKKVFYKDDLLNIKGKSFEILFYLIKNRNKPVISKDELVNAIWDEPELICNNVIEVNINQIRNEIKKTIKIDIINTIRNRGYKIKI